MTYTEDMLLPLSAIQHLAFCERQCALVHVERLWTENRYTAEGRIFHERVDAGHCERRGRTRIEHAVPLRSLRLGLIGKADVVEFHLTDDGKWRPFPVEYKRGRPKKGNHDQVQLCAQALCLEEMLSTTIERGALFYGKTRRRVDVCFDSQLRRETEDLAARLHDLIKTGITPRPEYTARCDRCSFLESCLPKTLGGKKSAAVYLKSMAENKK